MNAHDSFVNPFGSEDDRIRHYDVTRHVRFIEQDRGRWHCQECDEISTGVVAPGMEEDATRLPAPGMAGDSAHACGPLAG